MLKIRPISPEKYVRKPMKNLIEEIKRFIEIAFLKLVHNVCV